MSGLLYRLGALCARRRRVVVAIWLVALVATVGVARQIGEQTSDDLSLPGTDSTEATDLLDRHLPEAANGTNPVVLRAHRDPLTEGANREAVNETETSLSRAPKVRSVVSPLTPQGAAALSEDQRTAYFSVTLTVGPDELTEDEANEIIAAAHPAREAGIEVAAGGYLGQEVSKPDTSDSERIGIAAAVIILLFAFGTAVAMGLPIATAILGLITSLSLIGILGHAVEVPSLAPTLATMIGLAVGIDYSLFIVSRHRAQLAQGMEVGEAVARAAATAGSAVAFAGGTVVLALLSLVFAGIPIVSALGYSAAVAVLIAVLAALTLLPALLALLGRRIESLRMPFGRLHLHRRDREPHGWSRWAEGVARRPWPALGASVVVLAVLAIPVLELELGQQDNGKMPEDTETRRSYDLLSDAFGPGVNGPLLVAVSISEPAQAQAGLERLQSAIGQLGGVQSVSPPQLDAQTNAAVFTATPTTAPSANATEGLVRHLRDGVIPQATQGTGLDAHVGGQTASYIDLADKISDRLVRVIAIVVALSFLLLMVAFRSLVIPATSALVNLLAVAAAYGVLTAVFQKGWGVELIGLDGAVPIVSYVPLLMFAILFGLSMDYQVFLLSRVEEQHKRAGDARRSIVGGLGAAAPVIVAAALIMICVFTSFVLNGDPTVKQFGVGFAVAIAIDASVVLVLVPAIMSLLGGANWWLPGWLDRVLPQIGLEDEPGAPAGGGQGQRSGGAGPGG